VFIAVSLYHTVRIRRLQRWLTVYTLLRHYPKKLYTY
jgi:hypothetical protein